MNRKERIKERIAINNFSLLLTLAVALAATVLTAFFALAGNISFWAILSRSLCSFFLFLVIGFLAANLLWTKYARDMASAEDAAAEGAPGEAAADSSFDKVVIMNGSEEQK